jgi:MoxR-like ATPase
VARLRRAVGGVLQGKESVVDLALVAVLAGGHLLLQDVPGVGKTTLASALAAALGGSFRRVQFTSDLLPADLTGVNVLDPGEGTFRFRPGPLFAHVVLADEINRTTPKTQSALFEALATQNPYDMHGTFHLPDSQLDRFMMRLALGYPDRRTERAILRHASRPVPPEVLQPEQVEALRGEALSIEVPELVEEYLLDLVRGTRSDARFVRGVSTRGAQALHRAVRARAFLEGRSYAIPEDVRALAVPVLGHRVMARSVGSLEGDGGAEAVAALLDELPPPL